MKKIYSILLSLSLAAIASAQVCDSSGNVIIYSNYDGGTLNINVDQNIPNLKIGIVSYEAMNVNISGAFAGNVTEVRYAGYNSTNNTNCSPTVSTTAISGVPNSVDTIITYPPAGYNNPNGYSLIICNYSCNNQTSQGGCNTPDQVVHYFMDAFGGTFRYHYTQYGCFSATGSYNVSGGGNCCIVPTTLGVNSVANDQTKNLFPNPVQGELNVHFSTQTGTHNLELYNVLGQKVTTFSFPAETQKTKIDLTDLAKGVYFVKVEENGKVVTQKIIVE